MPPHTAFTKHKQGVIFSAEKGGSVTWSVTRYTQRRIQRFFRLQELSISAAASMPGTFPLRLVCLDGAHPGALQAIESSVTPLYQMQGRTAIEWEEVQDLFRLERRYLCSLTVNAWLSRAISDDDRRRNLIRDLRHDLLATNLFGKKDDVIYELALDFEAWAIQHLPSSLAAHVCRVFCLSAIPRAAWARKETGLAIQESIDNVESSHDSDQGATASLLDVADTASGSLINLAVLNSVRDILSEPTKSKVDGLIKRDWAISFANFGTRLLAADPRTAVLVGWAAYICESGTTTTENPAANTVKKYIISALLALGQKVNRLPDSPFEWRTDRLEEIYSTLILDETPSKREVLRAALGSFHEFLVTWFDVEPLLRPLSQQPRSVSRVEANVVWPHELNWCINMAGQCLDTRMGLYAQVILAVAANVPIRRVEVHRLHIRNISFDSDEQGNYAEIEIARDAHRGRLKSLSSQRRMILRDAAALLILRKLVELRRNEGAPNDAFLFGDPANDALRYRMAATQSHVNSLLKSATGQRCISLHTLRHSAISSSVNCSWLSSTTADISPLELIASPAGHATPATTLRSYSHLYEEPIRLWIDRAITGKLRLSASDWSSVLNIKPNTLVQRTRRTGLTPAQLAWQTLASTSQLVSIPSIGACFDWREPVAPPSIQSRSSGLVVGAVIWPLIQLQEGRSDTFIAQRLNLPDGAITAWREGLELDLRNWVAEQYPRRFRTKSTIHCGLPDLLHMIGACFERMWQEKYMNLATHLQGNVEDAQLQRVLESWRHCSVGTYISLAVPEKARELLTLFRASGVLSSALKVCIEGSQKSPEAMRLESVIQQLFRQVFDVPVDVVDREHQSGRTCAYLLWSSSSAIKRTNPYLAPDQTVDSASGRTGAADEIHGLIAWMVCIHAYLTLKRLTP